MCEIRKIRFFIASIFGIYIQFLDLLFMNKFTTILLALPSTLTNLLSLALNTFNVKFDDLVAFNNKISSIAIL